MKTVKIVLFQISTGTKIGKMDVPLTTTDSGTFYYYYNNPLFKKEKLLKEYQYQQYTMQSWTSQVVLKKKKWINNKYC